MIFTGDVRIVWTLMKDSVVSRPWYEGERAENGSWRPASSNWYSLLLESAMDDTSWCLGFILGLILEESQHMQRG